jgi:putative copper export protein
MLQRPFRRHRIVIAWLLCGVCSLASAGLAIFLWLHIPEAFRLRHSDAGILRRFASAVLPLVGFLIITGAGLLAGARLSRLFLTDVEFSVLTRAPRIG